MTAQEALQKSYLTWDEIIRGINIKCTEQETMFQYQMICPEDAEKLRALGYNVFENVGNGILTTVSWKHLHNKQK
jgi:hypothetical protein